MHQVTLRRQPIRICRRQQIRRRRSWIHHQGSGPHHIRSIQSQSRRVRHIPSQGHRISRPHQAIIHRIRIDHRQIRHVHHHCRSRRALRASHRQQIGRIHRRPRIQGEGSKPRRICQSRHITNPIINRHRRRRQTHLPRKGHRITRWRQRSIHHKRNHPRISDR